MRFIDPDGMWGDLYNQNGTHVGNDGVDDNKAYVVRTTDDTQLSQAQSKQLTFNANTFSAYDQNVSNQWLGGPPVTQQLSVSNSDLVKLAGVAYAESDAKSPNHDETYGIANASVNNYNARQGDSRGRNASFADVLGKVSNATFDGNVRYGNFMGASADDRNGNAGMTMAVGAAVNATSGGKDYSNGATGWDGRDLPVNAHRNGLLNTNPAYDIFHLGNRPLSDGTYRRNVTGAAGHTVFIKIDPAFVKRTGSPAY